MKKTRASQGDALGDFMAQRSPKSIYVGDQFETFWGNLDLMILATTLMQKRCFGDLEEVGICSFG